MKNSTHENLPRYRCHKEVLAIKIGSVSNALQEVGGRDDETLITPEDEKYSPFRVSKEFVEKHKPESGGYFVVYQDGYESFSPGKAFEDGYSVI